MRPIPHESTASYVNRLAHAYRTTTAHLLDAFGITLTHPRSSAAGIAELHLDTAAQHQLAAFTRTSLGDLTRALPHLADDRTRPLSPDVGTRAHRAATPDAPPPPAGVWQPLQPGEQPVLACPACTLRHTQGATSRAHIHPPAHQALCPRHQRWSLDPENSLTVTALPELRQAWRDHQRLNRHPDAAIATIWARAITTRWYDQQTVLATRWQHRLRRLTDTNPHAEPTAMSWALYARDLITYPEAIVLARALATARLPRQPRQGPAPTPHPAISAFCRHTAHRLGIARLAPPPSDLLWTWIHQARPTR